MTTPILVPPKTLEALRKVLGSAIMREGVDLDGADWKLVQDWLNTVGPVTYSVSLYLGEHCRLLEQHETTDLEVASRLFLDWARNPAMALNRPDRLLTLVKLPHPGAQGGPVLASKSRGADTVELSPDFFG